MGFSSGLRAQGHVSAAALRSFRCRAAVEAQSSKGWGVQCATRSALRMHLRTPPERDRGRAQGLGLTGVGRVGLGLGFGFLPSSSNMPQLRKIYPTNSMI